MKYFGEKEAWKYPGTAQIFLSTALLSQERVKLRTSNLASTLTGSIRTKEILGKWSLGVSSDCRNFSVSPIISGTGKATNFKFCTHILSIDRNKSPLQILGKVTVGVVRTLEIFQGTHIFRASRGSLCDSSALLFRICKMLKNK